MSDNIHISSPVEIQSDSKSRVAYDLMKWIAARENEKAADRGYWLKLYSQCYKAANGRPIKEVLHQAE